MSDNEDNSDSSLSSARSYHDPYQLNEQSDESLPKLEFLKKKNDDSLNNSLIQDYQDFQMEEQKTKIKVGTCIFTDNFEILTTTGNKEEESQPLANSEKLTCSVLTKFEKARILGVRARQIREHTALYIDLTKAERKKLSAIQIAERQLNAKMIPFKIRRHLPNNGFQEWELKDFDL